MNTLILLIAHAPLADALRECALHVFPECAEAILALDVAPDAAPDEVLARARALLQASGRGRSALVLADVFGATPCNIAQRLVQGRTSARLVSGVNLPMLLRAVSYRAEPLDLLVQRAVVGGTQGVMQVASGTPSNPIRHPHDQDTHDHHQ